MKRLGGLAAVLAAMLLITGCSRTSQSESEAQDGGVFTAALVRPNSEEPALADTVSKRVLASHLYSGLTTWDPVSLQTRPALAQRWEAAQENKVWTFYLRDARASNGQVVTAADVKSSFERIARKSAGSPFSELLSPVVGFADFSVNDAAPSMQGIQAVDARTIRIETTRSFPDLDKMLANPIFSVVHRNVDGSIATTGPMQIKSRPDPNTLVLTPSEGTASHVEAVRIRYFDDVNQAYRALDAGDADWSPVSPEQSQQASEKYGSQLFRPSLRTSFVAMKTTNPKLADTRFRQAIVKAVNRNAVLEKMGSGDLRHLDDVVPTGVPGSRVDCGDACAYDPAGARRLIAQVFGDVPPPNLTFDYPDAPPLNQAAVDQIVGDLAAVGIAVAPRSVPAGEYPAVTVREDRELFLGSWSAVYPAPAAFLDPLFTSNSPANVFELRSAQLDQKIVRSQSLPNGDERARLQAEIERDVTNQFPFVPLVQFGSNSVASERVRGLDPLPTGNFDISSVWLTEGRDEPVPS